MSTKWQLVQYGYHNTLETKFANFPFHFFIILAGFYSSTSPPTPFVLEAIQ